MMVDEYAFDWGSIHIPINPIKTQEEPFLPKQEPLEEEYEEVN